MQEVLVHQAKLVVQHVLAWIPIQNQSTLNKSRSRAVDPRFPGSIHLTWKMG